LTQQRAALDAQLAAERESCEQRFAVTSCLEEANARHAQALKPIVAREQALNEIARQERAAAQQERVRQRQQEAGSSEAAHRTELIKQASQPAQASRAVPREHPGPTPEQRQQAIKAKTEASAQEAAQNRERVQKREAALKLRQQDAATRETQRVAKTKGKKATALPTPSQDEIEKLKAAVASPASAASR
jgi:hypothetical protein